MREYFKIQLDGYKIFKENFNRYFGYQLITSLLIGLLMMPGLKLIFNSMMKARGLEYVTNGLLKKFIISPQGLILVSCTLLVCFIAIMMQLGGLIVLTHQKITTGKEIRFRDITVYCLKRIKYMFGLDGLIIVIYFSVIAPMLDSDIKTSLFGDLEVPGFIMQVIESNDFYNFILMLLLGMILFFSIRWIFCLHVLLLENLDNKRFLKRSAVILKNNLRKLVNYGIAELIFAMIVFIIALIVIGLLSVVVLLLPMSELLQVEIILTITIAIFMLIGLLSFPLTVIQMTILYHKLTGNLEPVNMVITDKISILNKILSSRILISLCIIGLFIGTFFYNNYMYDSLIEEKYDVGITAHRGSSIQAPENTLSAIKIAIDNGATHVEIDVQLTKDNQLILLHDTTFARTAGLDKRPDELLLSEIKELEVGSWFDKTYLGETVPTLNEVIDLTKDKIALNIEIKGSYYSPKIYEILNDLISESKLRDCVVTSLEYEDLISMENLDSSIKTGYIMFVAIGNLKALNVDFYSVEASNISENFVSKAHSIGREVHVWTINEADDMTEMLRYGVDNIITDYDYLLYELIEKSKAESN